METINAVTRIIQLEEVCISLEEAQALNNAENAAHAWVFNSQKHTPEFELVPVDSLSRETEHVIKLKINDGKWTLYNSDIFIEVQQVNELIKQGVFYFAPFKK